MSTEPESKSSPFNFDIYACPDCDYFYTTAAYRLISIDVPCPKCGERRVSEYQFREGKDRK